MWGEPDVACFPPHRTRYRADAAATGRGPGHARGSKDHIRVEDHGRIGGAFHGQVPVHDFVPERAADIALHHAAEAVVTRVHLDADVVDLVLEGLEMIAAVEPHPPSIGSNSHP